MPTSVVPRCRSSKVVTDNPPGVTSCTVTSGSCEKAPLRSLAVVADVWTITALEGGMPCFAHPTAARQMSAGPKTSKTRGYIRMGALFETIYNIPAGRLLPHNLKTHLFATHQVCVES